MKARSQRRNDANTSLIGLLVGLSVFTVSMTAILQVSTNDAGRDDQSVDRSKLEVAAANLADQIVTTPGNGWYSNGATCTGTALNTAAFSPDKVKQFGLAEESCVNPTQAHSRVANVSYTKIGNLQKAKKTIDAANNAVDYEEARKSLAYDTGGLNFHIRTYPILDDVATKLSEGYKDPNMKPLYIGDYATTGGSSGPKMVQHTKGAVDGADAVTVYVNITNNGSAAAPFGVWFSLDLKNGDVDLTLHTPVLAATTGYFNVTHTLRKTSDWEWNDVNKKWISYQISDKDGGFQSGTIPLTMTMTYGSARNNVFIEADKLWFKRPSGTVETKYHYESFDGKGAQLNFNDWNARLYKADASTEHSWDLGNEKKGDLKRDIGVDQTLTMKLHNDAYAVTWNQDRANVLNADPSPFTPGAPITGYAPNAAVLPEITYVDFLVDKFDKGVFHTDFASAAVPYVAGGDVFPDQKKALEQDLVDALTDSSGNPSLADVTVLIIGTGVDQQEMTPSAIKNTIADWVTAGGTLMVFGTDEGNDNWLKSVYHAGIIGAGSGISIPDQNHPVLKTPNRLDVDSYDYHNDAWSFTSGYGDLFTHVVKTGDDDILAVSNPGAIGSGKVILTSWWPYDPVNGDIPADCQPATLSANCPGLWMMDNFFTLSYSDLYLDYGPLIPPDVSQGAQSRIATVWHTQLKQLVDIQIIVYVWA